MTTGLSLHIGLNAVDPKHYSGWSGKLAACEADAQDMAALAKKQKFNSRTLRLTKAATRDKVLADLKAAAAKLKKGRHLFPHLFRSRRPSAEYRERFRAGWLR
jgi:hypothetical protein